MSTHTLPPDEGAPEWSFLIDVDGIGNQPARYRLSPDEAARKKLGERFGLLSLESLQADLTLTRERGGLVIHITGHLVADVVQSCVVTLEPVREHVDDSFEAFYADDHQAVSFAKARLEKKAKAGEAEIEMIDERDAPEAIENGQIDLGELVSQYLSLALNPYPRSPNAPQDSEIKEENKKPAQASPFAALKDWKDKL